MDKIFHPNERAWISETFDLQQSFRDLNRMVANFLPYKREGLHPAQLEIMPNPETAVDSSEASSAAERLSNFLGGDDFFKVKIKDDEMYKDYNYGKTEDSTGTLLEDPSGKELLLYNDIDYNEDPPSDWSAEEIDDDEMDQRWKDFGKERLAAVVATYASVGDKDPDNLSGSDEESDVNVFSESEDEELMGAEALGARKPEESTPSSSSKLFSPCTPKQQPSEQEESSTADASNKAADEYQEFQEFNAWAFKITKKRAGQLEEHQLEKLKSLPIAQRDKYEQMLRRVNPELASVPGETFQDDPIKANSSMPVLASPIPKKAKTTLQSLAIYISHQDDPTGFHWKSSTVQQQINEDIRTASRHNRQTANKEKFKTENADEESEIFVDMERDFLVTASFFHPKDTDNAAVDGIHKQSRSKEESEIIVGGRSKRRDAPATKPEAVGGSSRYLEPKLALQLTLLNTNTLSDLRDALRCENDLVALEEVEHPDDYVESEFNKKSVKTLFPSGMILVDDTIYCDNRAENCTDYSAIINKWAMSNPHKDIGLFNYGELSTTSIKDLKLRFGYPYVYIHQGSCEHIIVFNKARKLNSQDHNLRSAYPHVEGQIMFKNVNCRVDNEYIARWAVLDCDRFPENPMLVCTQCLKEYCYDDNGKKWGNFTLFPFKQVANTI